MSPSEVENLNTRLKELHGEENGKAKFRLVWSNSQIEKRFGTVNVFFGNIFIREETGIHELPKYPHIKSRWVLEALVHGHNPELVEGIQYEPIWNFQNQAGEYLEPVERAIDLIIYSFLNPQKVKSHMEIEEEWLAREYKFFKDYLDGELSYTASMLANKEGIVVPESFKGADNG